MSSSTSNSELRASNELERLHMQTRGRRRLTLFAVGVALLALELLTRAVLFPKSRDFQRLAALPVRGAALVGNGSFCVALLGNSATERGVAVSVLEQQLTASWQRPVKAEIFAANASEVKTWYYMLEAAFYRQGVKPDLLVVTFFEDNLADGGVEIDRLAQGLTVTADWPSVFAVDLPNFDERVQFVLASGWATLAGAPRIRDRFTELMVPSYLSFATALYHLEHTHTEPSHERARTYRALERFVAKVTEQRQRTVFVAYPTRPGDPNAAYDVDPVAVALLEQAHIPVIDLRATTAVTSEMYNEDGAHLLEVGQTPYTEALAKALDQVFQPHSARSD